ncbi:BTB/POZ domain-containing protein 2-like [Mercenaria mercenaria]|uniref:BTB/POZ domain-containing protein 2-like n=1 Tax=Mercenaria mercenaria TaxID=6596 RepID=UPI00234F9646|nr:BTB/POZ domain-containing protein 2-like [Mercenaria mercenaria]
MARSNVREETSSDFVESFRTTGLGSASPDWRDTKTASQCLDHLCLSKHLSDVTLRFSKEPSVKLPAHKFVLSMRSRVFEAMFNENKGFPDSTVTIDDVESKTMRVLIRFMYTDKSDIDGKNVLKCLQAAKQYAIAGLVANCSTFLEKNISTGNVCTIHEQAIYYKMKELQTKCFEFMLENASDVFMSDGFRIISKATLVSLLKSDDLAEDEENIFTAASTWAEAKCISNKLDVTPDNKRRCLGEALNEIRFPIMCIENFAK